jgi:hypothetical protein
MKKFLVIFFLLISLFPQISRAHGTDTSLSQTSGPYTLEFEYSGLSNLKAGDLALLDVYLLDNKENPVDFDSVFIKISDSNDGTVFYGTFKEASDVAGTARMGMVFNRPGEYKALVQFSKSNQIYPATYSLIIDPAINSDKTNTKFTSKTSTLALEAILVVAGLVLGLAIKSVWIKRKND